MPEVVSDILGKGLAFEQRVTIDTITQSISGTIAAFVGGANWGPVGSPVAINNNFYKQFGSAITRDDNADTSGLALEYHLNYSPLAWFTRVTNGKDVKASRSIIKPSTVASYIGALVKGKTVKLATGDKLTATINGTTVDITFTATSGVSAIAGNTLSYALGETDKAGNYSAGDYFDFIIDGVSYRYVVAASDAFTTLVDATSSGAGDTYASRWIAAAKSLLGTPDGIFTASGNIISANSLKTGSDSNIRLNNVPKIFSATPDSPIIKTGTDTSITDVIKQINDNAGFKAVATAYINYNGYFQIDTLSGGADKDITVTVIIPALGDVATKTTGTNSEISGHFVAKYTGTDGNTIQVIKSTDSTGKVLAIYFRDSLVARFFNYDLTVASSNYIGKLINEDSFCQDIVSFETPAGVTALPEFADGTYTLAGGSSGTSEDDVMISDTTYANALDAYTNEDLYTFDILCVSGVSSTIVYNKLASICEDRKDAFFIFDAPEDVAGLHGSPSRMIQWHNGQLDSFKQKIVSAYAALYYPYMLITTDSDSNTKQWVAPSVRMVGVISNSDDIGRSKTAAPAGVKRGVITDIEGLATYLRKEEKQLLYADELGNCINPIVFTSNKGFFVDGQKTCDRTFGPLSRLNIIRTAIAIKKFINSIADDFFWEPVTKDLRDELFTVVDTKMKAFQEARAIKEGYTITCDGTLNTEAVEAQKGLILKIEWEGINCAEKIKVISVVKGKKVVTTIE